jgi:hypothetical protein
MTPAPHRPSPACPTRHSPPAPKLPPAAPPHGHPPKREGIPYEEWRCRRHDGGTTPSSVRARSGSCGHGQPDRQAAQDLRIHEGTLENWVAKARIERGEKEGLTVDERAQFQELEREVAGLRMERDVLT